MEPPSSIAQASTVTQNDGAGGRRGKAKASSRSPFGPLWVKFKKHGWWEGKVKYLSVAFRDGTERMNEVVFSAGFSLLSRSFALNSFSEKVDEQAEWRLSPPEDK